MTPYLSTRYSLCTCLKLQHDLTLCWVWWIERLENTSNLRSSWEDVMSTFPTSGLGPDLICRLEIRAELRQDIITNAFNLPGNNITHATANIYIYQHHAMKTMRCSGITPHPLSALQTNHWTDPTSYLRQQWYKISLLTLSCFLLCVCHNIVHCIYFRSA